ncbi:MAG: cation:proton antiporter [Dehalococcoidia bacterium]
MESSSSLLISLALILLTARITSQVASGFGLPSVFGVLIAGVLLGPSVSNLVEPSAALDGMSAIGVVLLLYVAGLETDLVEMRQVGSVALFAAIGGVAVPMAGGTLLAMGFGYGTAEAVFVGTILTATSVTVSAHVLKEMGHLQGRVGSAILGAAIIDDIIGVVVLTVVVSLEGDGSLLDLVRLAAFIPAALFGGYWLIRITATRLELMDTREHRFLEVLALVLAFGWAAQEIGGLAAITGAYLAGVLFGRTVLRDDLADFGNLIGYALFAPVFFVTTGMSADLAALAREPAFTLLLCGVAIVTKIAGSYAGSVAGGFSQGESIAVGAGMVARGEVALVIAVLGRQSGVIGDDVYAASIAVTLLTTLAAPLLLRLALPRRSDEATESSELQRLQLAAQIERLDV